MESGVRERVSGLFWEIITGAGPSDVLSPKNTTPKP